MPGTKAGGKLAAETNKRKYGPDFYARIGADGGRKGRTGGFYADRERARIAGAKGGRTSSRKGTRNGENKRYTDEKKLAEIQKQSNNSVKNILRSEYK